MGLIDLISAIQSISSIQEYFLSTLLLFNGWLSTITSWFVKILSLSVVARAYTSLPIIQETWRILRDFSNMLFIVALIVMAFGTVFNKEDYNFNKLFPKFLIAAVFINFSLVIGGLVIDGFQVLTNVFLVSIGNLGDRLGQSFNLASLLPNAGQGANLEEIVKEIAGNADLLASAILGLIFLNVLSLFFLFAVAVSAVFSVARIPILWGLLILSPIAWMASIFPKTRNFFDNWWKWFIGWNMFLPIYLFFLSLGLLFLSRRNEIGTILPAGSGDQSLVEGIAGSLTFNLFFFYAFTVAILVFGLSWALKLSSQGGSWMTGTINWARGAAMRLPGLSQYDATRRAARKRFEQFRQEGFQGRLGRLPIIGYGGAEGLEAQRKSYERVFGVRGAEFAKSKDFAMRAKREQDIIREQYQLGAITPEEIVKIAEKTNSNDPRGFAYRNLAAEIGRINAKLFDETLRQLSKDPLAAKTFAETAKKAKFGGILTTELLKMAGAQGDYSYLTNGMFLPIRREMFKHIQQDIAARDIMDMEQFKEGIRILGGPNSVEGSKFRKEVGQINPKLEIEYSFPILKPGDKLDLEIAKIQESIKIRHGGMPDRYDLYIDYLDDPERVANMPIRTKDDAPESVWDDKDFQKGLKEHIKSFRDANARRRFESKLSEKISHAFGSAKKKEIFDRVLREAYEDLKKQSRDTGVRFKTGQTYDQYMDAIEEEEEEVRLKSESNKKREGEEQVGGEKEKGENQTASGIIARINPNNTLDLRTIQREDEDKNKN